MRCARRNFRRWRGRLPKSDWNGTPVVGPPEHPFPGLETARQLRRAGWRRCWVFRAARFVASWEPREDARMPPVAWRLHARITEKAGARAGCWDVFAWKRGRLLFVEVKRSGEPFRASQRRWLHAAIACGVKSEAFIVVRCETSDAATEGKKRQRRRRR